MFCSYICGGWYGIVYVWHHGMHKNDRRGTCRRQREHLQKATAEATAAGASVATTTVAAAVTAAIMAVRTRKEAKISCINGIHGGATLVAM